MGRKSRGRNSSSSSSSLSVRGMMRGLKNRWGRFQCPRDGSICISLEAWHWHRHKYHQTDPGLNYVELDPDVDDATPLQSTSPPTSSSSHPPHSHHPPSSPRLLPPEAFAPRRQPEVVSFPDDASDLTEPEIPFLLSEEVTSPEEGPPGGGGGALSLGLRWESMEEETEEEQQSRRQPLVVTMTTTTATTSDSPRSLLPETVRAVPAPAHLHGNDSHGNGSHGNDSRGSDSHGNQEVAKAATRDSRSLRSPSLETEMAHRHGNDLHGNRRQRHYRSRSRSHERGGPRPSHGPTTGGTTAAGSLSLAMDLVAVHVLRLLRRDESAMSAEAAEDILRDVESRFSGLGLSREGLKGVVAGALMGARDQWTNGYNAGWKDGASQVLNAPILLRSSALPDPPSPLHSPPGDLVRARNPGRVTLLNSSGRRSQNDDKEDAMPAEKIVNSSRHSSDNLEGSVEQTRNHGNDLNNNDAFIATDDRPN